MYVRIKSLQFKCECDYYTMHTYTVPVTSDILYTWGLNKLKKHTRCTWQRSYTKTRREILLKRLMGIEFQIRRPENIEAENLERESLMRKEFCLLSRFREMLFRPKRETTTERSPRQYLIWRREKLRKRSQNHERTRSLCVFEHNKQLYFVEFIFREHRDLELSPLFSLINRGNCTVRFRSGNLIVSMVKRTKILRVIFRIKIKNKRSRVSLRWLTVVSAGNRITANGGASCSRKCPPNPLCSPSDMLRCHCVCLPRVRDISHLICESETKRQTRRRRHKSIQKIHIWTYENDFNMRISKTVL